MKVSNVKCKFKHSISTMVVCGSYMLKFSKTSLIVEVYLKKKKKKNLLIVWLEFFSFFLAQIENSIIERTQNTINPAETMHPEWKSRSNAHLRPILPSSLDAYQNLIVRQSKSQSTFPVKHDKETFCFKP